MATLLPPLIVALILAFTRAELCSTSADCNDSQPCTLDFCELSTKRCMNLAFSTSCHSTQRALPRSKLIAAANTPPILAESRSKIARLTANILRGFHPHRLLHLRFLNVDPAAQLLAYEADLRTGNTSATTNVQFHERMFSIFQSIDDLHTRYLAPTPLLETVAFLPFALLPYYVAGQEQPRYVVTDIASGATVPNAAFTVGSRVMRWDGEPIHDIVRRLGRDGYGSNEAAQLANGVISLRIRFLAVDPFPQNPSVDITFVPVAGDESLVTVDWLYSTRVNDDTLSLFMDEGPVPNSLPVAEKDGVREFEHDTRSPRFHPTSGGDSEHSSPLAATPEPSAEYGEGIATPTAEPDIDEGEMLAEEAMRTGKRQTIPVNSTFCGMFSAEIVPTTSGAVGRLYINSFLIEISLVEGLISEFRRVLLLMPRFGLVVDFRDNSGGLTALVEVVTDLLTKKDYEFQSITIRATPLLERIVNTDLSNASLALLGDIFTQMRPSMSTSRRGGDPYAGVLSLKAIPTRLPNVYEGPYVVVADSLTYSSGDLFTALHADNGLAPVVISGGNVGAGGSTVFEYETLAETLPEFFDPLPADVGLSTSAFRILRSRKPRGAILENFGVEPDLDYRPTLRDRLENDKDLFEVLGRILSRAADNNNPSN